MFNGFECMSSFFRWLSVDLKTKGTLKQRRRNWDNDDDDDYNDDKRAYSIFFYEKCITYNRYGSYTLYAMYPNSVQ